MYLSFNECRQQNCDTLAEVRVTSDFGSFLGVEISPKIIFRIFTGNCVRVWVRTTLVIFLSS